MIPLFDSNNCKLIYLPYYILLLASLLLCIYFSTRHIPFHQTVKKYYAIGNFSYSTGQSFAII
jgi:hypothetical protein